MLAFVVISPAKLTYPVLTNVSHATRLFGSSSSKASRMASEIWSEILSGCPSVTDSDVKMCHSLYLLHGGKMCSILVRVAIDVNELGNIRQKILEKRQLGTQK